MKKLFVLIVLSVLACTAEARVDFKAMLKDAAKNAKSAKPADPAQQPGQAQQAVSGVPLSEHNGVPELTNALSKLYNNLNRASVHETLVKGLYRADFGPRSAQIYVNEALTLILETNGNTITKWTQPVQGAQPISDTEKRDLLYGMLHNIQMDKLIQIKQGDGHQRVLVISAFDCPYCIKFERMLANAGNKVDATFYILPTSLNWDDSARANSVHNLWCAADNASVWRNGLLKSTQAYPGGAAGACTLGVEDTKDVEVLLSSVGLPVKGYPFKMADNAIAGTAAQELEPFLEQLNKGENKSFWSPQMRQAFPAAQYAQFRSANASNRGWYK
ncbi:MAG: hypothetical protein V4582_14630 [Pseudomonadota bacterium]